MPKFEWDPAKAATNRRLHGVSFEQASKVFTDQNPIEWADAREDYGEDRSVRLGQADGRMLVVVYTEREDRIRIISARRAKRAEHDLYYRRPLF